MMHRLKNTSVAVFIVFGVGILTLTPALAQEVQKQCPPLPLTLDLRRVGSASTDTETGGQISSLQKYLWQFNNDPAFGLTGIRESIFVVGYFGSRTDQAVRAFQSQAGLVSQGIVTADTRNAIYADCIPRALPEKVACPVPAISQDLAYRDTNDALGSLAVSSLQAFLYQYKDMYLEWRLPSFRQSLVTGGFYSRTRDAVGRFQGQFGVITSSNRDEYRRVGPATRAAIEAQCDPAKPAPDATVKEPQSSGGPPASTAPPTILRGGGGSTTGSGYPFCTGSGTPIPPGFCNIAYYESYLNAGGTPLEGFPRRASNQSTLEAYGSCNDGRARAMTFNIPLSQVPKNSNSACDNWGHYGQGSPEGGGYGPPPSPAQYSQYPAGSNYPAHPLNPTGYTANPPPFTIAGYTGRGTPIPPGFCTANNYIEYLRAGGTPLLGFPDPGNTALETAWGTFGDGKARATVFNVSMTATLKPIPICERWGEYTPAVSPNLPPQTPIPPSGSTQPPGQSTTGGGYAQCTGNGTPIPPGFCTISHYEAFLAAGGTPLEGFPRRASNQSTLEAYGSCNDGRPRAARFDPVYDTATPPNIPAAENFGHYGKGALENGGYGPPPDPSQFAQYPVGADHPAHPLNPTGYTATSPFTIAGYTGRGTPIPPGFYNIAYYKAYLDLGNPPLRGFPALANPADYNDENKMQSSWGKYGDGRDRATEFDITGPIKLRWAKPICWGYFGSGAPGTTTTTPPPSITPTQPQTYGGIIGIAYNRDNQTMPVYTQVHLSGNGVSKTLPTQQSASDQTYLFNGLPTPGTFTVSIDAVPGYSSIEYCLDPNASPICPSGWKVYKAPIAVLLASRGETGLWWRFIPATTITSTQTSGTNYEVRGGFRKKDNGECIAPNPLLTGNRCECQSGYTASIFGKPRGTSNQPGTIPIVPIPGPGGLPFPGPNPFGNGTGDVGSPGVAYMCVRQSQNTNEAYQGGYMTRPNDIVPTQTNSLAGVSKCPIDTIDDTVAKVLGPEGSDNTIHACRKPYMSYSGTNRSSYGGLFHKRIEGSCTQANVLTGGCSCPSEYTQIPIANISGTGESAGVLWLCMRSDTVDSIVNPPATSPASSALKTTPTPIPILEFAKQNSSGGCCSLWSKGPITFVVGDKIYERISNAIADTPIYFRWTSGRTPSTQYGPMTLIDPATSKPYRTMADGTKVAGPFPTQSGITTDWAGIKNSINTVEVAGQVSNSVSYSVVAPTGAPASLSGSCPCLKAVNGRTGVNNFCFYGSNYPGCPMTARGGYCDTNADGVITFGTDTDWVRGWTEYNNNCASVSAQTQTRASSLAYTLGALQEILINLRALLAGAR